VAGLLGDSFAPAPGWQTSVCRGLRLDVKIDGRLENALAGVIWAIILKSAIYHGIKPKACHTSEG